MTELKLYKAFQKLLHHSVDKEGLPKKASSKQIGMAIRVLYKYERKKKCDCSKKEAKNKST